MLSVIRRARAKVIRLAPPKSGIIHPMAGLAHATPTEYERIASGMTARDYFELPEDHPRCELIAGELWMPPAPTRKHQNTVKRLLLQLAGPIESAEVGEVLISPIDYRVSEDDVFQPDLLVLSNAVSEDEAGPIVQTPLLVVEVLSAGSIAQDRGRKFRAYEAARVSAYWIVDPATQRLEIWLLDTDGRYRLDSVSGSADKVKALPFPDVDLDMSRVFPPPTAKE